MKIFTSISLCIVILLIGCGKDKPTEAPDTPPPLPPIIGFTQVGDVDYRSHAYTFASDLNTLFMLNQSEPDSIVLRCWRLTNMADPVPSFSYFIPLEYWDQFREDSPYGTSVRGFLSYDNNVVFSLEKQLTSFPWWHSVSIVLEVEQSDMASVIFSGDFGHVLAHHSGYLYTRKPYNFYVYDTTQPDFPLVGEVYNSGEWDRGPGIGSYVEAMHFWGRFAVIKQHHVNGDSTSVIVVDASPSGVEHVLGDARSHLAHGVFAASEDLFFLAGRPGISGLGQHRLEIYRVTNDGATNKISILELPDLTGVMLIAVNLPYLALFARDGHSDPVYVVDISDLQSPSIIGETEFRDSDINSYNSRYEHPILWSLNFSRLKWYELVWP